MKTIKILLISSLFATASLSAAEAMFRLNTKVIVLPQKEFAANQKFDGLISDNEMQLFLRDISKLEHAKISTMPSIILNLDKVGQIDVVSEKELTRIDTEDVERIGDTITYRLKSIEGVLRLDGVFKHSELEESDDASVAAIEAKEIIFKRDCALDKSILVSKGDLHLFITLTQWKEEE